MKRTWIQCFPLQLHGFRIRIWNPDLTGSWYLELAMSKFRVSQVEISRYYVEISTFFCTWPYYASVTLRDVCSQTCCDMKNRPHYSDVIIGAIPSQITSLTIVYATVYSNAYQRKHQSSASLAFVGGNSPVTGEFPAQMASNAKNVSIWWRHHVPR